MKNAILLLCATIILTFLALGCKVYFKSNHYEQTNTIKEGKTVIKKPNTVVIGEEQSKDSSFQFFPQSKDSVTVSTQDKRSEKEATFFSKKMDVLLKIEGGFQLDTNDLSNKSGIGTKYGITAETAKRFSFNYLPSTREMQLLSKNRAKRIYQKYFEYFKLDHIQNDTLAFFIFDGYVNMPSRMPVLLNECLKKQGIGFESEKACRNWVSTLSNMADSKELFDDLWELRCDYYKHRAGVLEEENPHHAFLSEHWTPRLQDKKYLNGWLNRMDYWKQKLFE